MSVVNKPEIIQTSWLRWLGLGGVITLGLLISLSLPPIINTDAKQLRFNQPTVLLRNSIINQSFLALNNGLSAVEVWMVVYPESLSTDTITITLSSISGVLIAEQVFVQLKHNEKIYLDFAPVQNSGNQTYILTLTGSPNNTFAFWSYSLDGDTFGKMYVNDQLQVGDLYFRTFYTYVWKDFVIDVVNIWLNVLRLAIVIGLTLFVPGYILIRALKIEDYLCDFWATLGIACALSIALNTLAWQWISVIGWSWSPRALWVVYLILALAFIKLTLYRWVRFHLQQVITATNGVVLLVFGVSITVRLLAVQELAFPQWVDSPHHLMIARLLANLGHVPTSYAPLLPVIEFNYHYGFHALAATWYLLTGYTWPDIFLGGGQALNSLIPLVMYAGAFMITQRSRPSTFAAWIVGFVSLFPAYYTSWGRYTQLTGLLLMIPLLAVTWRFVVIGISKRKWRWIGLIAVLASGLTLTHYRVLFFYTVFTLVAMIFGKKQGRLRFAFAVMLAILLSGPLLWYLSMYSILPIIKTPSSVASPIGYNNFPWDYFSSPLERGWYALTSILAFWSLWHQKRFVWGLVLWVIATTAILNIGSGSWLVNNNSWAISLFVPGALVFAIGADDLLLRTRQWALTSTPIHLGFARGFRWIAISALTLFIVTVTLIGLRSQISVINPTTTLYTPDDLTALHWVEENIPQEAVFAHNSWNWQAGVWAAADGGAWLWPWLGYRTTLPPIDYSFDPEWTRDLVDYNERLMQIKDAQAPETLALWQEVGVTHIYIGARGGNLKPEMFVGVPGYKLLYTNGAAWVFEIER